MKRVNKIIKRSLAVAFGLMLLATVMFGQTFKATIVGQITDSNGAVVPNATVTIIQDGTNISQTVNSNANGEYVITQLDPGTYSMRIEMANFKTAVKNGLVLETAQSLRFNVALEIGDVSAEVTVTSEAAVVNTETSSKGEVIVQKQVQDLPLNGRDFTDLALLTPGVYRRPADDDQGEGLATSGTRTDASNYILDGAVNKSDRNGAIGVTTSIDSIQEFKVETSTYTAEYGRSAGAQINVVTKSGSNKIKGSLFDYVRNDIFDANNFFTPPDQDRKLRRNDFGGSIGGPLPFFNFGEGGPVFHNGKDRSFFFFSYEGRRAVFSESAASNAPQASWLQGDFSNVRGAGNDGIYGNADDTNRVLCITTTGAQIECPTPNVIPFSVNPAFPNILPANSTSLQIASRLPAANAFDSGNLTRYLVSQNRVDDRNKYLGKLDFKITDKNNFSVRYSIDSATGFDPFPSNRNFYPGFGRDTERDAKSLVFNDTHIFSSNFINEIRVAGFWQTTGNLGENRDQDYVALLGIPGLPASSDPAVRGYPAIRIDGFSEIGDRPNDPFAYELKNYQLYDSLTYIFGNHVVKAGAEIVRSNYIEADVRNVRGDFRFRGRNTNPGGGTRSGFGSFADFLYGLPDSTQRQLGSEPADLTGYQYAFFLQDNWRVTNWLTLNLGVRYEVQTPLTEATGRIGNFVPSLGEVILSGDPRLPEGLIESDYNNIGPRIGFALRPFKDDKTVVRGGAGIYYSLETFNPIRQQLANTFPFLQRESYSRLSSNRLLLTFQNPFPDGRGGIQGLTTPFGLGVDYKTPEIYQYNLTVERELAKDLAVEVGYVGSLGRHLGIRYNINDELPTGALTTGGLPVTARPFPTFGNIQYQEQIANSWYNGLQVSVRRRAKNGLTLLTSYTFSRSIDTASSTNNSTSGTQKFPQNVLNLGAEKALSDFHRKHQFSASFNYELPFGKGRAFAKDAGGIVDTIIGGWQLNGIVTLLSGAPFTPQYNSGDISSQRPDLVGDPYSNIPTGLAFNPAAFAEPVPTADDPNFYGNAGRNILIGPYFNSVDMSLNKNFRLHERMKLQFRWEVFNLFNTVNFQTPGFRLDNSDVGQYSQTANESRTMQFAFKLLF